MDARNRLMQKISSLTDEEMIVALEDDVDCMTGHRDITDLLSVTDAEALQTMVNEPFGTETETLDEFKAALRKWLTK